MKTLVLLAALLSAAVPAYADPICFDSDPCGYVVHEHSFQLDAEVTHELNAEWNEYMGVPVTFENWTIPAFDFSLGVPEVLLVEVEADVTITGRIHDLNGASTLNVFAIASLGPLVAPESSWGIALVYAECTAAPCDFVSTGPEGPGPFMDFGYALPNAAKTGWEQPLWDFYLDDEFTVPLFNWTPDTFFRLYDPDYDGYVAARTTIGTHVTGVARATYLYEPFAAEVPEPTTLLLVGSGLIGAEWKRRRR